MERNMPKKIIRSAITAAFVVSSLGGAGISSPHAVAVTATSDFRLSISGRRESGQDLSAELTGVPNNANVRFQWFRNGTALAGATNRGRGISGRDIGQELMVRATISVPGRADVVLRSSAIIRDALEDQIFAATNAARAQHGLSPLARNTALDIAARNHSIDMAVNNFVGHDSSDGRNLVDRFAEVGVLGVAENALGHSTNATGQAVVAAWMRSPGHRANILTPNFTEIGIGVARTASGGIRATQKFYAGAGARLAEWQQREAEQRARALESWLGACTRSRSTEECTAEFNASRGD
jgi:uncharacterized protein YkwD